MGIEIYNLYTGVSGVGKVKPNIQYKSYPVKFTGGVDVFENNSPLTYCSEERLNALVKQNPQVMKILDENGIELKYNIEELKALFETHCQDTQRIAMDIVNNLPPALKQMVDIKALKEGCIYHDFGKVLIPSEILNKPARLTPEEHKIMDLHPELGYQMLKTTGIDEKVLMLVRNHHNRTLVPPDINVQILNLADMYSALTEKRVYKEAYDPKKALTIVYSEVQKNNINPLLYNALVKSIHNTSESTVINDV